MVNDGFLCHVELYFSPVSMICLVAAFRPFPSFQAARMVLQSDPSSFNLTSSLSASEASSQDVGILRDPSQYASPLSAYEDRFCLVRVGDRTVGRV